MNTYWPEYFEKTKTYPASKLLEMAFPLCHDRKHALDLGAGALRDSKFLLSAGFKKVTATDSDATIKKYAEKIPAKALSFIIKPFEKLQLRAETYNLINAQFALPFTSPPHLPELIDQIKNSLKPGGIFCANFFGPKDDWAKQPNMTFTSKTKVRQILKGLKIILLNEKHYHAKTADGSPKNWHIIEIIAQQKPYG